MRGYSLELYNAYLKYLEDGTVPDTISSTKENFRRDAKKHENLNGVLLRKKKIVLKADELSSVWQQHHVGLGHPGNLLQAFFEKVFFPVISKKT